MNTTSLKTLVLAMLGSIFACKRLIKLAENGKHSTVSGFQIEHFPTRKKTKNLTFNKVLNPVG